MVGVIFIRLSDPLLTCHDTWTRRQLLALNVTTSDENLNTDYIAQWGQNIYALSFYGGSKMILDGSNSFWSGSIHFGQVQIIKISPEKSDLNPEILHEMVV